MAEKKTVKVQKFLNDFRAGKNRDQLMKLHGLTSADFDKLIKKLVERQLLSEYDAGKATSTLTQRVGPTKDKTATVTGRVPIQSVLTGQIERDYDFTPAPQSPSGPSPDPRPISVSRAPVEFDPNACPQCNAKVSEKALICPECGHVLRGAKRWEDVEPKKKLTERIPPLMWGVIVATPFAVILFYFFTGFMLPATESQVDKRIQELKKETPKGRTPMDAAKDSTRDMSARVLDMEAKRMVSQGVFSEYSDNYRSFTTGPQWIGMSEEDQERHLSKIQETMRRSGLPVRFVVVDPEGKQVARVSSTSIEMVGGESTPGLGGPSVEAPPVDAPPPPQEEAGGLSRPGPPHAPGVMRDRLRELPGR